MKKKVLIVDDTLSWVKFNQNLIETFYPKIFDITTVQTAWDARLAAIENLDIPYDLIITDLQMENFENDTLAGEWLIKQIKGFKEYKNTKFLIISGMPTIKHVAERNNVAFISKPRLVSNNNALRMVIETFFPFLAIIKKTIL